MDEWQPARIVSGPHDHTHASQTWLSLIGKTILVRPSTKTFECYKGEQMYEAYPLGLDDTADYYFCEHEIETD